MLSHLKVENILFLDIETVPIAPTYSDLADNFQHLWAEKTKWQRKEEYSPEEFYVKKAGVMAEFAKIVCISVGYLFKKERQNHFRIKCFYGDKEDGLLTDFANLLNEKFDTEKLHLCAHNGKEFDYPFLCRRMLVNGIKLPKILDI